MSNNQFTPHAIAALKFAQREALERGKSHIAPEHLLLGILHERESVAAHVLAALGDRGDWDAVRSRAYAGLMSRLEKSRGELVSLLKG